MTRVIGILIVLHVSVAHAVAGSCQVPNTLTALSGELRAAISTTRGTRYRLFRGLNIEPSAYDPTALGRTLHYNPRTGRWSHKPTPDIWVHSRLDGAVSYATGMTANLAGRQFRRGLRSLVLEFELPEGDFRWEAPGADRGIFSRRQIPNDSEFLTRVGILSTRRPKPSLREVTRLGPYYIEWYPAADYFDTIK